MPMLPIFIGAPAGHGALMNIKIFKTRRFSLSGWPARQNPDEIRAADQRCEQADRHLVGIDDDP
jgi:hypothetical protein